jgi:hypothetical protein
MRPKRTFFRSERVRVVPPRRGKPAAGAAGGPALPAAGVRRREPLLWRACEGLDLAASRPGAPAGPGSQCGPQSSRARPASGWARGDSTQPSLLAPTRGGWEGPLYASGTGTQRGEQAQWQGREFDTSHVNWPAQCPSCCYVETVLVTMAPLRAWQIWRST